MLGIIVFVVSSVGVLSQRLPRWCRGGAEVLPLVACNSRLLWLSPAIAVAWAIAFASLLGLGYCRGFRLRLLWPAIAFASLLGLGYCRGALLRAIYGCKVREFFEETQEKMAHIALFCADARHFVCTSLHFLVNSGHDARLRLLLRCVCGVVDCGGMRCKTSLAASAGDERGTLCVGGMATGSGVIASCWLWPISRCSSRDSVVLAFWP